MYCINKLKQQMIQLQCSLDQNIINKAMDQSVKDFEYEFM